MARIMLILFFCLLAGGLCAQKQSVDERLIRIEESTSALKKIGERADERLEAMQKDLRGLQDRVVAVDSQNKIIMSIAGAAFTIGLGFLIWLWKKFDAIAKQNFTEQDRLLLAKIYEKIPNRSASASGS